MIGVYRPQPMAFPLGQATASRSVDFGFRPQRNLTLRLNNSNLRRSVLDLVRPARSGELAIITQGEPLPDVGASRAGWRSS